MITRREFVAIACATAYGAVPGSAFATQAAVDEAMRALTGGAQVRRGRVKLDECPPLLEECLLGGCVPVCTSGLRCGAAQTCCA